jgi:hypothetical protein
MVVWEGTTLNQQPEAPQLLIDVRNGIVDASIPRCVLCCSSFQLLAGIRKLCIDGFMHTRLACAAVRADAG